jgi:hypothetical protein
VWWPIGRKFGQWIVIAGSFFLVPAFWLGTVAAQERMENSALERPSGRGTVCPYQVGDWVFSGYGSAAVGKTSHQVYAGHLGLGYYFVDCLSLNLEAIGYFVDHAHDSGGGGIDLLPRWHFFVRDKWSLYLDGGPGFIYTKDTLRDPGTHFNFTVQAGLGITYRLSHRLKGMAGYRWFHISNARIRGKDRNVGFDSPMFYLGLVTPF